MGRENEAGPLEELFTAGEVARARKVSEQFIYNAVAAWERGDPTGLQAVRHGRAIRITKDALLAWDRARAEAARKGAA